MLAQLCFNIVFYYSMLCWNLLSYLAAKLLKSEVSFFEYLEKIELYYSKKNNSENVFRELKNSKVLF